jgi:hypothetical protein
MINALYLFRANIQRVRSIHALHASFSRRVTAAVDLSDILRAEIVLIVSALDHFVHVLTRSGMMEVWRGNRPATAAYLKFPVSLGVAAAIGSGAGAPTSYLEAEIRARHGFASFQKPDDIATAVRLFSTVALWNKVADNLAEDPKFLKARLKLIVERRNKIAHEADVDPSFPGLRWPIEPADIENALTLVEGVGEAIYQAVST